MASAKGARTGAMWGTDQLQANENRVLGELGTGYGTAQGYLGQAGDVWKGMAAQGQTGLDSYKGLALGDPASVSAAVQNDPRYRANVDPGMQGLLRARSAAGMLNSGNTDTDAMTFMANLGNATYGQMLADKLPLVDLYKSGTAGQAGTLGAQAALATDYYGNRASMIDNTTKSIVGLGTEALKAGDAAKSQNQANMINIGMGLGKLALGGLTGGIGAGATGLFGGGGLISNGLGAMTGFQPFGSGKYW